MVAPVSIIVAVSVAVACLAVLLFDGLRRTVARATASGIVAEPAVSFLFDRDHLVDCTPSGRALLARAGADGTSLSAVLDLLEVRFPDIADMVERLGRRGETRVLAADGSAHLALSRQGDSLRIEVEPTGASDLPLFVSAVEFDALKDELSRLRGVAEGLPYPIWREDEAGQITWVNRAYLDLCRDHLGGAQAAAWPPRPLFERPATKSRDGAFSGRLWIGARDGNGLPYEVTVARHEDGFLCSAIAADSAMRTENSLRDLVQTLTKTFAQISIGVAVFSRDRRMVLFNPALVELTQLRPESLALGPTFFEFLDTLRDRRLVPEPKDYKAWRAQLSDTRAAAATGGVTEVWHLPDGRSLRIAILPQPEGAMALLLEDITGQVLQNRSFRGTLELHQLLLDQRDEAIAVFAQDRTLVLCNDAYDRLWGTDHGDSVAPVALEAALGRWRNATLPSAAWEDFPRETPVPTDTGLWVEHFQTLDGRPIEATARSLAGGYLNISFRVLRPETEVLPRTGQRLRLMA